MIESICIAVAVVAIIAIAGRAMRLVRAPLIPCECDDNRNRRLSGQDCPKCMERWTDEEVRRQIAEEEEKGRRVATEGIMRHQRAPAGWGGPPTSPASEAAARLSIWRSGQGSPPGYVPPGLEVSGQPTPPGYQPTATWARQAASGQPTPPGYKSTFKRP